MRGWDNAVVESFFGTLKKDLIYRRPWVTRDEAAAAIHEYIEVFYNRIRRHSTLGGKLSFPKKSGQSDYAAWG